MIISKIQIQFFMQFILFICLFLPSMKIVFELNFKISLTNTTLKRQEGITTLGAQYRSNHC